MTTTTLTQAEDLTLALLNTAMDSFVFTSGIDAPSVYWDDVKGVASSTEEAWTAYALCDAVTELDDKDRDWTNPSNLAGAGNASVSLPVGGDGANTLLCGFDWSDIIAVLPESYTTLGIEVVLQDVSGSTALLDLLDLNLYTAVTTEIGVAIPTTNIPTGLASDMTFGGATSTWSAAQSNFQPDVLESLGIGFWVENDGSAASVQIAGAKMRMRYLASIITMDSTPPSEDQSWLRPSWLPNTGDQRSIGQGGGGTFERAGVLIVQVFTPKGLGWSDNNELCEAVMAAFEGIHAGAVWFRRVRTQRVGITKGWAQQNVVIEWQYDEHK